MLDVKLPFDERALLLENRDYLLRSLKLEELAVHSSDDAAAAAARGVDASKAYRGVPVPYFC